MNMPSTKIARALDVCPTRLDGMIQERLIDAEQREHSAQQNGQDQGIGEDLAKNAAAFFLLVGIFQ